MEAADAYLRIADGRGEAQEGAMVLKLTKPGRGAPMDIALVLPPSHIVTPYAIALPGGWQGAQSALEARTVAWDARGGHGQPPPPVWYHHPEGGWVLLAPGPPKASGPSGRSGSNPVLRVTLRDGDLAAYQLAADAAGLTVQDWARRVLRAAVSAR